MEDKGIENMITAGSLIEYLRRYPEDSHVSLIAADPKKRKSYEGDFAVITDMEEPVFIYCVTKESGFDEEQTEICDNLETPEIITMDNDDVDYNCRNCNTNYIEDKTQVHNFCPVCGIRFRWDRTRLMENKE